MLNEANLKNAILQRAVFTRSDLGGANIEGADFTNALVDKTQQQVRPLPRAPWPSPHAPAPAPAQRAPPRGAARAAHPKTKTPP